MKSFVIAAFLLCAACNHTIASSNDCPDANVIDITAQDLVCASNFCGLIVDKNTGAAADCGSCANGETCGDNGISNVCGSSCQPLTTTSSGITFDITPACDFAYGNNWWVGYAAGGLQISNQCNYTNPNNCAQITNLPPPNRECSDTVCGTFWCCLDGALSGDGGLSPLLDGAVANSDGGLP